MEPSDLQIQGGPYVGAADEEGTEVEGCSYLWLGPQVLLGPALAPRTMCSPVTVHKGQPQVRSQAVLLLTPARTGMGCVARKRLARCQTPGTPDSFTAPAPQRGSIPPTAGVLEPDSFLEHL